MGFFWSLFYNLHCILMLAFSDNRHEWLKYRLQVIWQDWLCRHNSSPIKIRPPILEKLMHREDWTFFFFHVCDQRHLSFFKALIQSSNFLGKRPWNFQISLSSTRATVTFNCHAPTKITPERSSKQRDHFFLTVVVILAPVTVINDVFKNLVSNF